MATKIPINVGEVIRLEIERRDWTQGDLALIMNRPIKTINEIINGKSGITANTAWQLEAALGVRALDWLNLQSLYQLSQRDWTPTTSAQGNASL